MMAPKSVNPYGICFIILRFLSLIHIVANIRKTDECDIVNAINLSVYPLFYGKTAAWQIDYNSNPF